MGRSVSRSRTSSSVARGQLMPGPGWDGGHVVRQQREGLAAADERPGAAGHHDDRAGGFPARPGPGAGGQALEQAAQGGQGGAAGERVAVLQAGEGAAAGGPGHQPPQGRVGLVPRVAADRAVLSVARAGREQRGGSGGGSRGVPDGQRVAGVRVVADEARPQAQHERDVEAVHPHHGLVAAGMDVAVPAPAGREDEVARFHRHAVPVDDHAGAAAREPEPYGGDGMGVDGGPLAGEEHLVGRRDRRGGTGSRRSEPRIAQDQRAALQAGRVGRELAGPGELGIDVLPVPDVPALGASGLGELLTLPERQRGQLCQPLVIVRDIGRGKGVAHCSSSYQGYAPLRRSMHFPGRRQHLPDGVYPGRAGHT